MWGVIREVVDNAVWGTAVNAADNAVPVYVAAIGEDRVNVNYMQLLLMLV